MTYASAVGHGLETKRLRLEPIADADVAALVRLWGEEAVARYLWIDHAVTLDAVAHVVTTSNKDFQKEGYGVWALRHKDDESLIGICGLRRVEGKEWIEILFSLRQRYWGRGLGTEAAFAVLEFAFSTLRLDRIVAMVDPSNAASVRILKRANMVPLSKEGETAWWKVTARRFRAARQRPPPPVEIG